MGTASGQLPLSSTGHGQPARWKAVCCLLQWRMPECAGEQGPGNVGVATSAGLAVSPPFHPHRTEHCLVDDSAFGSHLLTQLTAVNLDTSMLPQRPCERKLDILTPEAGLGPDSFQFCTSSGLSCDSPRSLPHTAAPGDHLLMGQLNEACLGRPADPHTCKECADLLQ